MMQSESERRRVRRHSVHVPITLASGEAGVTSDISAAGVAFQLGRFLAPGTPIRFVFDLEFDGVVLRCEGRVVRCEERGDVSFAAATIEDVVVDTAVSH